MASSHLKATRAQRTLRNGHLRCGLNVAPRSGGAGRALDTKSHNNAHGRQPRMRQTPACTATRGMCGRRNPSCRHPRRAARSMSSPEPHDSTEGTRCARQPPWPRLQRASNYGCAMRIRTATPVLAQRSLERLVIAVHDHVAHCLRMNGVKRRQHSETALSTHIEARCARTATASRLHCTQPRVSRGKLAGTEVRERVHSDRFVNNLRPCSQTAHIIQSRHEGCEAGTGRSAKRSNIFSLRSCAITET